MTLRDYLDSQKMGASSFAKKAGMKQPYTSLIINGKRKPSAPLALRIEQATNGVVTLRELLFPEKLAQGKEGPSP